MKKVEVKKRIKELKRVIKHHRYLYHVLDTSEISDEALDSLKYELKELEDKFPDLITPDSPTQRVGGKPLDKFEKITRASSQRMYSLNDAFSEEDIIAWLERLKDYFKKQGYANIKEEFYCDLKMDGLAIELVYDTNEGFLKQASTRGDGIRGELVTQNVKTIEAIPLALETSRLDAKTLKYLKSKNEIRIRGEAYLPSQEFRRINMEQEKKGEKVYANPRNIAAGSIRQLDSSVTASRKLNFAAYGVWEEDNKENLNFSSTHAAEYENLKKLGLSPNKKGIVAKGLSEVFSFYKHIEKIRDSLPYQIDGIVITLNDNKLYRRAGHVGKAPRAAIAYKFPAKQAATIVQDIKVHVGRTGAVTPVAILKPVKIDGATISRASLHNQDEIDRLGVMIGDTVIIERAGDVIPKVIKVIKDLRPKNVKKFKIPSVCAECKSKLERNEGEAIWRCNNPKCESRKHQHMNYFVSKAGFDIEGLGPKIIEKLMDTELISDAVGIFSLREGDLSQLEGFQEKSAKKIIGSITASKEVSLSQFIRALSIRHVGEETAIDLANNFGSIKKIQNASLAELIQMEGVGDKVAHSIHEWFRDKDNKEFVAKLLKSNIKILPPLRNKTKLSGISFVITGSLKTITREEAQKTIRTLGGKIASSVSKNIDYLVVGENPGSKYDMAKKVGVKIIREKEFLNFLK